jgi:hypothetical protein
MSRFPAEVEVSAIVANLERQLFQEGAVRLG